ncbi:DDE-type integrase/transposase/recombinase [Hyphobacterium sp. CCMP332]|nr:DDE-type integrase/transposase/recombinase [Hyphobacterium sp. CCMP332]
MRYSQSEKMEIIRIVEGSEIGVVRTLFELGIPKSTFYKWYGRYLEEGYDGLASRAKQQKRFWNKLPPWERQRVVEVALEQPELSPRELAYHITDKERWYVSESTVYRILKSHGLITSPAYMVMKASDSFRDKTKRVHQMWQTDFTYLKVIGWGMYYLSSILDDYSRYIIHWELCSNMTDKDVERNIIAAIQKAGLGKSYRPKLLSDNGPCYKSGELKSFLETQQITHVNGKPYHPQTQGKIERYHRSMKNIIKLDVYYSPDELKVRIAEWVNWYNNHSHQSSLLCAYK